MTLLLVRVPEAPLAHARFEVPGAPASVPDGRLLVTRALEAWGCDHLVERARLLTSEALTNAIVHGRGPVTVRLRRTERDVTVEVTDADPGRPEPRHAQATDESGRGLTLIETLADGWGSRPTEGGKVVWFTLGAAR